MREQTRHDEVAIHLYEIFGEGQNWTPWGNIKRGERDYWRACAQVAIQDGHYPKWFKRREKGA